MFTDRNIGTMDQNVSTTRTNIFWAFEDFLTQDELPLHRRIYYLVRAIQFIHYPILAMTAVPDTDWSVWYTVAFTFDRFVAICYQKMKRNYCTEKTATFVLGTVSVLSFSKNIFWYFMFTGEYFIDNIPWFCLTREGVRTSENWATATFVHHIFTSAIPFVLILLLNGLTVRHILVTSRVRRRLRGASSRESFRDPEMESRRKSVTLLYAISANFILLWSLFTGYFIWVQFIGALSSLTSKMVIENGRDDNKATGQNKCKIQGAKKFQKDFQTEFIGMKLTG
ncbi:uncharacterized protein [Narcine bancroftii]|uniref:uncharacterized protein n=1 Tax=Narcine bancroftii TaxID=1343680 RepID=UPI003831B97F